MSRHSGPDNENPHHWHEEDLERDLEEAEKKIDEMNEEILRLRISTRSRLNDEIARVENRREYVDAKNERNRLGIALMEHRSRHGSRHRSRRLLPNLLSDEQIQMRAAARRAIQRGERAPGGDARRNSRRHSLRTSPVNTPPQSTMRFATIGGGGAFTTPPRSASNRSTNQEQPNTRTSPIQTPNRTPRRLQRRLPPIQRPTGHMRPVPSNHTGDVSRDELQSSPGNNDGRRPGDRGTGTAERNDGGEGLTGQRLRYDNHNTFKPTLKF